MIIGYARVSPGDQKLDGQFDALKAAGAEKIFADKITGTVRSRPELDRVLDQLRSGDVIPVTKYDRLARSLRDLLDIVDAIQSKGAGFRPLAEDIDTTTPVGRLVFHVFASSASGFLGARRRVWRRHENVAVSVAALQLFRQCSAVRCAASGMRKPGRFQRSR